MIPFLARAAVAAASRIVGLGGRAKTVTPRALAPRVPVVRPTPWVKPNKMLDLTKPRRATPRVPTHTPPVRTPATRTRINVPQHPGTAAPVDRSHADVYHRGTGKEPTPKNDPPEAGKQGRDWLGIAGNLGNAAYGLKAFASDLIPGITWHGGVTARGFKVTPLRDVLHYCLAVVFGLVHQSRVGSTLIKVDCFPIENRVEISFQSASAMLLEPYNVAAVSAASMAGLTTNVPGGRTVGPTEEVINGIKRFVAGVINPVQAFKNFVQTAADVNRLLGAGGIWDMGQSNIYAGRPPASMILNQAQPFTDMQEWSFVDKRPMLTRDLAYNPEPVEITGMHSTHYDLRSLVAQALYDPGVLPPPPDTAIALAQQDLPNG
jgi:hypothetical protein